MQWLYVPKNWHWKSKMEVWKIDLSLLQKKAVLWRLDVKLQGSSMKDWVKDMLFQTSPGSWSCVFCFWWLAVGFVVIMFVFAGLATGFPKVITNLILPKATGTWKWEPEKGISSSRALPPFSDFNIVHFWECTIYKKGMSDQRTRYIYLLHYLP